jgi:S-formylglutathione hydrolase
MGGHGALTIFLKNADVYKSVSAYAPICNPINVQWGQKAFSGYLGDDQSTWKQYDATELVKQYKGPKVPVLIDIGTLDNFKDKQLSPEAFQKAAEGKLDVQLRLQVRFYLVMIPRRMSNCKWMFVWQCCLLSVQLLLHLRIL